MFVCNACDYALNLVVSNCDSSDAVSNTMLRSFSHCQFLTIKTATGVTDTSIYLPSIMGALYMLVGLLIAAQVSKS